MTKSLYCFKLPLFFFYFSYKLIQLPIPYSDITMTFQRFIPLKLIQQSQILMFLFI